jgi:hypothetical protein
MSKTKEYYHEEICEGLRNDREGIAPRRETSTHHNLRKESASFGTSGPRSQLVCTSEDETQTDLGCELP